MVFFCVIPGSIDQKVLTMNFVLLLFLKNTMYIFIEDSSVDCECRRMSFPKDQKTVLIFD